jgi:hypothetical protein
MVEFGPPEIIKKDLVAFRVAYFAAEDIRISQRMPMSSKDDVGVGTGLMGSVDSTESDDHG